MSARGKGSKRRLGRGLDGLLPAAPLKRAGGGTARIEELRPGVSQPRRNFDDEALDELAASIRAHGLLEPILVRESGKGFEIIAGERRWRAAQRAGLKEVPIFVRELTDKAAFEAALVENLQREDLNPIETARAFQRLSDEFGHTQEQIAERVGKDRSTVANAMRLLSLPESALALVEQGALSEGHGRALLSAGKAEAIERLARAASASKWSVRETERRARQARNGSEVKPAKPASKSANVRDLEKRLSHALGAPVSVEQGKGEKGAIRIVYASYDALDGLIDRLIRAK